jgi:hypothetical protein
MTETLEEKCQRLEHWETDAWAIKAVLNKEILTALVIDPCVGTGILAEAAKARGHHVAAFDVEPWGYAGTMINDWLNPQPFVAEMVKGETVLMNPPFTKSEKFVDQAFKLGARKIVCFQRFDWYEGSDLAGKKRGAWWRNNRPARIWICGDRANCHLHSYPEAMRKEKGSRKQAYAFFVWEQGHPPAGLTGHIFKSGAV